MRLSARWGRDGFSLHAQCGEIRQEKGVRPASQRTRRAARIVAQQARLQGVDVGQIGRRLPANRFEESRQFGAESGNASPNNGFAGEHARRATSKHVVVWRFRGDRT